jgi:hypothetical protein
MKTLLALAALLAAAFAAVIFPEMKPALLLIPFVLALTALTSGCGSTGAIERALRKLPDGHIDKVTVSSGNLGVSATITGDGLDKQANKISATRLNATLNTPWSGTTVFNLEGWTADVSPNAHAAKKPAPVPAVPAPPPPPAPAAEPEKKTEINPPLPAPIS